MSQAASDPIPDRSAILRSAGGIAIYAGAFGATFGAVAVSAGLSVLQACTLSLVMFTGASQFAFAGVIAAGGAAYAAIVPALLLGVRNAFYGVPVSEVLRPHGWRRFRTAHFVIDESTGMLLAQDDERSKRFAFWATAISLFCLWQTGTLVGALLGSAVDPRTLGLDAAGPAVFLALMWPQLKTHLGPHVAVLGAVLGIVLIPLVPAGVPVVVAGLASIAVGLATSGGTTPEGTTEEGA